MSFDALAWAGKAKPGSAPRKLVLLALADRHSTEDGLAWPSIKWLSEWTDLNRKTIITALQDLEVDGFIADSGHRVGATKQVKAYRLLTETVPKTEQSQKRNSPVLSREQSQKRDTDTVKEPVSSEAKASSPRAWARPKGVDTQVWKDLLSNRKRKNKSNTSPTAWKRFCDDLRRVSSATGIPPPTLIEHAAAEGWAGIYDPNARDKQNGQPRQPANSLRGHRPDPAVDLYRAAIAAEERENRAADRRAGVAIPPIGPG